MKPLLLLLLAYWATSVRGSDTPSPVAAALTSYHVATNVQSRLAETSIIMQFENSETCTKLSTITLQLPRSARVKDLSMELSDGCELSSELKTVSAAIDDFDELSSQGKPAALLTAWDTSNYQLQVSIPPNGTTTLELRYQELLLQRLNQVSLLVPLFPGRAVKNLLIEISVEESNSGIANFAPEDFDEVAIDADRRIATARFEANDVLETSDLPRLVRVGFEPGPLPDEGLFLSDGDCFTHVFNPSTFLASVGSMARNIVFVIDVSGSMNGEKLQDAKSAFAAMIETLDERDKFYIQTFSDAGTEALFGGIAATAENKVEATSFVSSLQTIGGTNLNDAFLDGISRARDFAYGRVPIIVMLTDGQGNMGPRDVARNVLNANEDGQVKIFNLAFGQGADYDLLLGISIQNGGQTIRVYEGFGDAVSQMEWFYRSELGSVLLSDIGVSYETDGNAQLAETTNQQFPVLAGGSEVVVRGRFGTSSSDSTAAATAAARNGETILLHSTIVGQSADGHQTWLNDHEILPINLEDQQQQQPTPGRGIMSECYQSFAQARIAELLQFRDAERALGDDLFFGQRRLEDEPSFEKQAEELALSAGLVWNGLTALVTVEGSGCNAILDDGADVCHEGDAGIPGFGDDLYAEADAGGLVRSAGRSAAGPQRAARGGWANHFAVVAAFTGALCWCMFLA